jgi:hypothetical protein
LRTLQRPFSYQVPARLFPKRISVLNQVGEEVYRVDDLPLADDIPVTFDSVRTGRRTTGWRSDRPATLYWVEALDGGDASVEVAYRDAVFQLPAPFQQAPEQLWQTSLRYNDILWGNDTLALGIEAWYDTRRVRMWQLNPDDPEQSPTLLEDRDYQDRYNDPGQPDDHPWPFPAARPAAMLPTNRASTSGGGEPRPKGVYPFLDRWHLATQEKTRLWQAADPYYESVVALLNDQGYPNHYPPRINDRNP